MTNARLFLAACMALTCILIQPSALVASQTADRQASERWERKPGEFEEYRSFLGRFDEQNAPVSRASSESRRDRGKAEEPSHAVMDQEQTPLTTLKTIAITTINVAGKVVKTVAMIVVGSALVVGYVILESQRQFPRSSH